MKCVKGLYIDGVDQHTLAIPLDDVTSGCARMWRRLQVPALTQARTRTRTRTRTLARTRTRTLARTLTLTRCSARSCTARSTCAACRPACPPRPSSPTSSSPLRPSYSASTLWPRPRRRRAEARARLRPPVCSSARAHCREAGPALQAYTDCCHVCAPTVSDKVTVWFIRMNQSMKVLRMTYISFP